MKVLHLPSTYLPDNIGGKEVFIRELIRHTPQIEHRVLLHHKTRKDYVHEGTQVYVLPPATTSNYRYSYFSRLYEGLLPFEQVLDDFKPDVVHFHDQSGGASLSHLMICKSKNINTLVTYHSPGQSCLQRALIFSGKKPCDGEIILERCASCQYQLKGVPAFAANQLAKIKTGFDRTGRINQRNKTDLFYSSWKKFYELFGHVHVSAQWLKDLLILNNVSEEKIHYIELGGPAAPSTAPPPRNAGDPLRIVFIGRCTDIKGIHVLVNAVKHLPEEISLEVYFYGPGWDDTSYGRNMLKEIGQDKRFKTPSLIKPDSVVPTIQRMDVCVIPSLWPETGPITVFDAFAAGIPVIGTDLAGIRERVSNGKDGLLFPWADSEALAARIRDVAGNPELLRNLKSNVKAKRTFRDFALEVGQLYSEIGKHNK